MYGTEGCSEFMAEKLPYSAIIGKHVRKGISSGVSVKDIMASIQKYYHAPSSTATFYQFLGGYIAVVQFYNTSAIGNFFLQKALACDFNALEFY